MLTIVDGATKQKKQISCRSIADSLYIYAIVPLTHANPVGVSIGGRYYSFSSL
jgi:hypothetical protein